MLEQQKTSVVGQLGDRHSFKEVKKVSHNSQYILQYVETKKAVMQVF